MMRRLVLAGCLATALDAGAALNDVFPTDYGALSVGNTALTTYLYHRNFDSLYTRGNRVLTGDLQADVAALRAVHFLRVADYIVAPMVVLPYSTTQSDGAMRQVLKETASGMGDFRFGATAWAYSRPETRDHLAVTLVFTAPTGEYETKRAVNPGDNRWKTTLAIGWIHGLGERWTVEVIPELAWYGSNDSFNGTLRQEQASTRSLTGYLRYRVQPGVEVFVGGQVNGGGETTVNGIPQNNGLHNSHRESLGMVVGLNKNTQLIARYTRENAVENGLRLADEAALRLLLRF